MTFSRLGFCDQKDIEIFRDLQKVTPEPPSSDEDEEKKEGTQMDGEKEGTEEDKKEDSETEEEMVEDITDDLIQNARDGQPDMSEQYENMKEEL